MYKELKQLSVGVIWGKPVIEPISFDELSDKDKKESLKAVNFIAQKHCGKIKGQTCAKVSRQCKYVKEGDSFALPTVPLDSIITMLLRLMYMRIGM